MSKAPWRPSFAVAAVADDRARSISTSTVEQAVRELVQPRAPSRHGVIAGTD
jgi:hypothetical protein